MPTGRKSREESDGRVARNSGRSRKNKQGEMTVTNFASILASTTALDWMVFGCVGLVATMVATYRMLTRNFGWGPVDT
jgi:hypothetical protein